MDTQLDQTVKGYKPLGRAVYDSIPHIHTSYKSGPRDHFCSLEQSAIVVTAPFMKTVWATTKLDGSCVAVAKLDSGEIVALTRAGYYARSSNQEQHHLFADWVDDNKHRFEKILMPGEHLVGEWLAQAHGRLYNLKITTASALHNGTDDSWLEPFVALDLVYKNRCHDWFSFMSRVASGSIGLAYPDWVQMDGELTVRDAMRMLYSYNTHHAEGIVFRVESIQNGHNEVEFRAKWVHHRNIHGKYLKGEPVWNWHPTKKIGL